MRKLLLASAAIFGATGGLAFAQAPSQGQLVAPWAAGPAANNNNNVWGTAIPGAVAVPTPGTVVIRLNGRVEVDVGAYFTSADKAGSIIGGGSFKLNPIGISSYMRLYPGVDGMATNGLRYGAAIELRENVGNPNTFSNSVTVTSTTAGSLASQTSASSPSGYSSSETVFVRRAFVYVGSDKLGIVRIGQTDGVIGLFDNGSYTSQTFDGGLGNFNGGAMQANTAGAGVAIPFAWLSQAGAEYSNTKIVYLTPQFFGFDFGLQYAPNMGNSFSSSLGGTALQAGPCNAASSGCISVTTGNDPTRWLNQVAVGARYQGTFGGVNVGAFAVYETAGKEQINGGGIAAGGPGYTAGSTSNAVLRYDNLNFVNAAVKVEVPSVGLTWAFDYIGGALNGQLSMRPTGGAPENAFVTGLVYKNGPWVVGAEVGVVESQGQANLTKISQRKETEFAIGGTYNAAPGLAFVLEYMHTERHQGQFDFVTNSTATGTRDVKGNGVTFATVVTW
jgi:hypothetical protein